MPQIDIVTFLPIVWWAFLFLICSWTVWQVILFPWISSWNKEKNQTFNHFLELTESHQDFPFFIYSHTLF